MSEDYDDLREQFKTLKAEHEELKKEFASIKGENTHLKKKLEEQENITHDMKTKCIPNEETAIQIEQNPTLVKDLKYDDWICKHCIIRPDAEVASKMILGHFRITMQISKEEVTKSFRDYLAARFKKGRLGKSKTGPHGYIGVELKEIIYPEIEIKGHEYEKIFIKENYVFLPTEKERLENINIQYSSWKTENNIKDYDSDNEILKRYLKSLSQLLISNVWSGKTSGYGFYGLVQKANKDKPPPAPTTAKKIVKIDINTEEVLAEYISIAKGAERKVCH